MRCPKCACQDDRVVDSRSSPKGNLIRRRRECLACGHRFTTYEELERLVLMVVKRDGRREPFSKDKLLNAMQKACQKRPVGEATLTDAVERISADLLDKFDREVPFMAVGERVMGVLREMDEVAYVRYASVYRRFEEASDFLSVVKKLEAPHDTLTYRLPGFQDA